jgi:hypothetical protein
LGEAAQSCAANSDVALDNHGGIMSRYAFFLTLALCSTGAQSALATTDIGLKQMGVAVGVVSPEDVDTTFGFGIFADLGSVGPRVRIEPRIDYWSQSEDILGSELSVRDITVGTRVKYFFPVSSTKVLPFGGAGLGLHFLNAEVQVYDPFAGGTMTVEDSATKVGLDLGGGIVTPLNTRTNFHAEAWYGIVSDFSQFSLRLGLARAF